jgi:hypothetical protein
MGRRASAITAAAAITAVGLAAAPALAAPAHGNGSDRLPVPPGAIQHIIVIDLENESFGSTFGARSPATYLNDTLVPKGELIPHYYATGHVSLDNYIAQVSGQAPNLLTSSDCVSSITSLAGSYTDLTPGTLDLASVQTIGNQLDRAYPFTQGSDWREYAEDMGNDPARDGGQAVARSAHCC